MNLKKLVIVGDSAFAEIAKEYFEHDSDYQVVAFAVEKAYLKRQELHGLPVEPYEELLTKYNPENHDIYVAIVYSQLNRLRTRLANKAKEMGYKLASYIAVCRIM